MAEGYDEALAAAVTRLSDLMAEIGHEVEVAQSKVDAAQIGLAATFGGGAEMTVFAATFTAHTLKKLDEHLTRCAGLINIDVKALDDFARRLRAEP